MDPEQLTVHLVTAIYDYDIGWHIAPLFYNVESVSDDPDLQEILIQRKHSQLDGDFLSHEEFHACRCCDTGFDLKVKFHPVADIIEVTDEENSFRLLLEYRKRVNDEGIEEAHYEYLPRITMGTGLTDFVTVLKLTTTPDEYSGFEVAQP